MKRLALSLSTFLLVLGAGSAQASVITYTAALSGASEEPSNASPASGEVAVLIDDVANTMTISVRFSGLLARSTAAHIHCCTAEPLTGVAGVATAVPNFPGFPLGVTADSYEATFGLLDLSSYNPAFVVDNGGTVEAARATLLAGIASGRSYFNIHSELFGRGEIRGFLQPVPDEVPEPGSLALMALGAGGLALLGRRRAARVGAA